MYTLFPWDCSSIGQSTALSRRKLRVRAPSVPTDPNPLKKNTSIHLCICCEKENKTNSIISFPRGYPPILFIYQYFSILFISFTLIIKEIKYGNYHLFNQYRLIGERHMQISTMIGKIIFRIPRDTVRSLAFSIIPNLCNRVLYVYRRLYTNGICMIQKKINLTQ